MLWEAMKQVVKEGISRWDDIKKLVPKNCRRVLIKDLKESNNISSFGVNVQGRVNCVIRDIATLQRQVDVKIRQWK